MLVKMNKEEKKQPTAIPEQHVYFPRLMILYSLIIIVIGVISLSNFYEIPRIGVNVLLIIAGL